MSFSKRSQVQIKVEKNVQVIGFVFLLKTLNFFIKDCGPSFYVRHLVFFCQLLFQLFEINGTDIC